MSNGVITLDDSGKIATCNAAGLRILKASPGEILNKTAAEYFAGANYWVMERCNSVDGDR